MDSLIGHLEKKNYTQAMKLLEASNDFFKTVPANTSERLLDTLNYHTHTLIIQGLLDESKLTADSLILFNRFLREFDYEQVKLRPKQFYELCKKYVNGLVEAKAGIKIVKGLQIAIERISVEDDGLSPLHTLFVRLCLQTKIYKQAVPLLKKAVTSFNKSFSELGEEEISNYFYYGGHLLMGLKQYEEAYLLFRFCLQLAHSYIYSSTLNAKKKLILLVLRNPKIQYSASEKKFEIDHAFITRYLDFARSPSEEDAEVMSIFTKAYMDLIKDEKYLKSTDEFVKYLAERGEVFEEDKNLGLVREIFSSFHLRKLKQLKKVYQNMTLVQVAKNLDVKENEVISHLIKAFAIKPIGRIDLKNNAVIFVKARDNYRLDTLNKIHSLTTTLKQVSNEYNKEHETIIRDRISMPNTIFS